MQRTTIRTWFLIHKWTSIVCTGFLLMLCVTGLPLIFHDEIDLLTEETPDYGMPGVGSSGEAPGLRPLDEMLAKALAARPGEVPVFMAFDNEQPSMTVTTAPRADSPATDMRSEEHTSELQSLMRISYAVFCLKKKHNI